MDFNQLISNEIEGLHNFFQQFFTGEIQQDTISRFSLVLEDNFSLITPGGQLITRENILAMVKQSYDSRKNMRIWTNDIVTRSLSNNLYVTTYQELQEIEDGTKTVRLSTAIFRIDEAKVTWIHVHETWVKN